MSFLGNKILVESQILKSKPALRFTPNNAGQNKTNVKLKSFKSRDQLNTNTGTK